MKTEIYHINDFERELTITVPWDMIQEEYEDLLKQFLKLPVKGFRQGKAPVVAVESTYRNQLKTELATRCSTRFCRKALQENKMEAGSPLEVKEVQLDKNKVLQLKVQFIEMPPFELPDYTRLDLHSKGEEDVLNEISEKLLEQTHISIPPALIENELNFTDLDDNAVITEQDKISAEERVKLMLILKKIASLDKIEVDEKELEKRIKQIAEDNEVTVEELKEFLISQGGFSRLSDSLLAEQVLKYIIEIQNK